MCLKKSINCIKREKDNRYVKDESLIDPYEKECAILADKMLQETSELFYTITPQKELYRSSFFSLQATSEDWVRCGQQYSANTNCPKF